MPYSSNIWKMYMYRLLLSFHFIGGILVPFFMDWGGISFTQLMLLQSVFVFSIFLLEVPTGAIADHFGRKTSLVLSGLFTAASAIVYTLFPSIYLFIIGEILWATGFALMSGADDAIIYDTLKHSKSEKSSKKVFGRYSSFELIGISVAAPIGSVIAAFFGLKYAVLLMAIPFLGASLVALSLKEPKIKARKIKESKRYLDTLVSGMKYFKNHKVLQILAFDRISTAVLVFFIIWTYQPLLKLLGVPLLYFGFIHMAIGGVQVGFMNNFTRLEKLFGSKKRYLLWSALITGVCFIWLGFNTYVPLTIVLLTLIGGFGLSRYVLFQSYYNKYIESHNRATVISTMSMVDRFIRALAYPLIALLVEWSLTSTLIILGVAIISVAFISRVEEKHLLD
ncbi:MFS transporter [Candidatus Woesearchaeota archaeon]|nr:MFS transporter [Candidatus Woesearchaeota archaeon]MBT5272225.1 MFS transporter [Candidatus Woesearchaeota archaeon]MBT6040521.1 MFS transporter [Candidatus Woesearchaeota archaeon]MBT6336497.1 MFS transporter [Candidatus Woesearchaeota archaeon]MBT7927387.1 MFS transporter [Candidatus Woesearchaeota archaeon]